jgi:hypothetical protein
MGCVQRAVPSCHIRGASKTRLARRLIQTEICSVIELGLLLSGLKTRLDGFKGHSLSAVPGCGSNRATQTST